VRYLIDRQIQNIAGASQPCPLAHITEDKILQCHKPLSILAVVTSFIRKTLYNMPKPALEGLKI